jgi:D-sedoheptulose 7-phosphate isomerase
MKILKNFINNINYKKKLLSKLHVLFPKIDLIIKKMAFTLKRDGKIFICGNGGSAADAQHLAAEFLVRLRPKINRRPLPVISLAMDTSTITACANDYGFENLFSRNLQALATSNDILICISTSGNSKNIIKVLKLAKKIKVFSVSFLGSDGGVAKNFSDINLIVPSRITARIQECHIFLGHFIFESLENEIFFQKN